MIRVKHGRWDQLNWIVTKDDKIISGSVTRHQAEEAAWKAISPRYGGQPGKAAPALHTEAATP